MKKLLFLVSGSGGSLKFIYEFSKLNHLPLAIDYVIGDRKCGAIDYAIDNKIKQTIINFSSEKGLEQLKNILSKTSPDMIITNVHKIIPENILNLFPNKFLNLHYSLLPAFKGLIGMKTIDVAEENNVKFIGCTCHIIDEKLDEGTIISQAVKPVEWSQPKEIIHNNIFQASCLILINSIIDILGVETSFVLSIKEFNHTIYNPSLMFDPSKLTDLFWKKIK